MPAQVTQLGNLAGNALRVPNKRPTTSYIGARRSCIMASTGPDAANISRRAGLLTTAGGLLAATSGLAIPPAMAAEKAFIEIDNLSSFQKAGQRKLMLNRAITELKKVLTPEDAPLAVRLVLADAATYDVKTGKGGVNASIILSGELNRPENAALKPLVDKLRVAKQAIDEGAAKVGQAPITWADTIVVAGKVATELSWVDIKIKRAAIESGGRTIAEQFGTEFPLQLGRLDAIEPDAPSALPPLGSPVADITEFLSQLGAKPSDGPALLTPKPPFWERPAFVIYTAAAANPTEEEARFAEASKDFAGLKRKYDISRNTVTRTDYEVDFITFYTRLADLGAKFDTSRYLYRIPLDVPTKL